MSKTILTKKAKLTKRQYDILVLRVMKVKYPEIQKRLSIGKNALRRHLVESMFKLNLMSQQELIDYAKTQKWIECTARDNGMEYKIKPYEELQTVLLF